MLRLRYKQWEKFICEACSKEFEVFPSRATGRRFCSRGCWSTKVQQSKKRKVVKPKPDIPRVSVICETCGGESLVRPCEHKQRFCSWECRTAGMRGEKGANARWFSDPKRWEKSERTKTHRFDQRVIHWREAVFKRDGFKCRMCGYVPNRSGTLNAHHIRLWSRFPELRLEVSNGVTLCVECHKFAHKRREVH